MSTFYGYTRASTAGQQYTYEAQRKAITKAYEDKYKDAGYEWGGFFEDKATSGGKPFTERDQGLRLWIAVQAGDVVCWSKMDRAFRNVFDAAQLLEMFSAKKVSLLSLDIALDTGTALGRFVMQLLASVAELEREWVRTRTKEALAIRQEKGLPHGGRPPAGWMKKPDGTWAHDPIERRLMEWLVLMHDKKGWSWDRLVAFLKRKKLRRANGDKYHQPWIHYALKARDAGYPGRDGWREKCSYGGSIRREKQRPWRRRLRDQLRDLQAKYLDAKGIAKVEGGYIKVDPLPPPEVYPDEP
jgi:DNA invertase Pin-like site-specific DNA recombinase